MKQIPAKRLLSEWNRTSVCVLAYLFLPQIVITRAGSTQDPQEPKVKEAVLGLTTQSRKETDRCSAM